MSMPGVLSEILESTTSSSSHESDSHVPRRAPVTYGRRRHVQSDASSTSLLTSIEVPKGISSTGDINQTASSDSLDAPSEPECADDEKDDEEQGDASPTLVFGWKKRLMEMDDEDDLDLMALPGSNDQVASFTKHQIVELPFKAPRAGLEIDCAGLKESYASKASQKRFTFNNSDTSGSPRRSPQSPATSRASNPSTPGIGPARRRVSKRTVVPSLDSDSEPSQDRLDSSTNTSPPLIFQTPGSRSSPTPPTSDDEMPSRPMSKGKGKTGTVTRRGVPPLQFMEESLSGPDSGSGEGPTADKQKTAPRIKAPTKKDLVETTKSRARLAMDQHVSIPKADSSCKFTIQSFFTTIAKDQIKEANQSSDPIIPFSSSPLQHQVDPQVHEQSGSNAASSKGETLELKPMLVEKDIKTAELLAMKRRFLASKSAKPDEDEDEEDDLVVVAKDSPATRHLQRLPLKDQKKLSRDITRQTHLVAGSPTPWDSKGALHKAGNQAQLSRQLLESAKEQGKKLIKQKEEEWVRGGGRLKNSLARDKQDLLRVYVQKGLENTVKKAVTDTENTDSLDQSMEEQVRDPEFPGDNSEEATSNQSVEDPTRVNDELAGEMADEAPRTRSRKHRLVAVIDSDSESEKYETTPAGTDLGIKFGHSKLGSMLTTDESDDNSGPTAPSSLSMAHRDSVSSLDDLAEDRSDKENNQKLMFDRSEDKENRAVVRHGIPSSDQVLNPLGSRGEQVGDEDSMKLSQRSPFAVLSEDEPNLPQPGSSWTNALATQPIALERQPSFNRYEAPLLQPSFSDLFEATTERQHTALVDNLSAEHRASSSNSPLTNDLGLTQDLVLQPAFSAGDQVLRKADSIFEKEQEYLLEAAHKKAQKKQFYVNDFGFLTQTRPNDEDAELYKSPLVSQRTQNPAFPSPSISDSRKPLGTLTLSGPGDDDGDDESIDGPRHRLVKRRTPSPSRVEAIRNPDSPLQAMQARNAFDMLMTGANTAIRHEEPRNRLGGSEFVEAEAEESDDDDVFGIGMKKDDDEEDGEDLDQTLEALVDDRVMDENTLAPQRVLEKFKEQEKDDDQELEKLHQAAVKGELRRKKRNRMVGLDDSDEESDEDERNRKIRRKMNKRQRIDRDNIKALANNEETKSFYKVYEHDLVDDENMELAHLQHQQDVIMDKPADGNGEDTQEPITREEIGRRLREIAQRRETDPTLDPHDVSWIDGNNSDEEININIKYVNVDWKKPNVGRRGGLDDHDESFETNSHVVELEGEAERSRLQSWARIEGKRCGGTVRSGGPVAVTGHAKPKGKDKKTPEQSPPNNPASRRTCQRTPLKPIPSVLAGITDRSGRFG